MRANLQVHRLDVEPGNGTRYRLVVTEDPDGGWLVVWPDARLALWASDRPGGELKPYGGVVSDSSPRGAWGAVDLRAVSAILDEHVRGR